MGKCDCKAKYARRGICDLGATSFKSQYLPKDDVYINFNSYDVHYPCYVKWKLNVWQPRNFCKTLNLF